MKVMEGLSLQFYGKEFIVAVHAEQYHDGGLAIQLTCRAEEEGDFEEPFGTLTVNMANETLDDGEVFVKNWSENKDLIPWAVEQGILGDFTGRMVESGFVRVPVYKLGEKFLQACIEKGGLPK